jgi:flagellar assembly protein FliH
MSGFRPLFTEDAPKFEPLQPEGAEASVGAPAPSFKPLVGVRVVSRPTPPPVAPADAADGDPEGVSDPDLVSDPSVDPVAPAAVSDEAEDVAQLKAREQGFELGREQGLAAAQAEIAERVEELDALVAELTSLRSNLFRSSVQDLGAAITHIAERVVGRELAVNSSGVERLVIDVLDHVQSTDEVVIRIAPEDERQMRNAAPSVLDHLGRDATFRIEVDPKQSPGGAVVQTQLGSIDASVETRFRAFEESIEAWVTEELGSDEE